MAHRSRPSIATSTAALAFLLFSALGCAPVRADLLRSVNEARAEGCGGHRGVKPPLRSSTKLNEAARLMARGDSLREAMDRAGYHGVKSSSIQMSGWLTDSSVARIFSSRFCNSLRDPQLQEIGYYRKGRQTWFVLAQPFSSLPLQDASAVSRRVLQLVNEARSRARRCGNQSFAAAGPVRLSAVLSRVALAHSRDMAKRNYFEHESPSGSTPSQRVTDHGYKWRLVGENLAAGITSAEEAVQGWLDSPHHCVNVMDPRFTEMGVAFVVAPSSKLGIYWTQVFALPR